MALSGYLGLLVGANREVQGRPRYGRAPFSSASPSCGPINGAAEPDGEVVRACGVYDEPAGGNLLATFAQPHMHLVLPADWINQALNVVLTSPIMMALNASTQGLPVTHKIRAGSVIGTVDGSPMLAASDLVVCNGRLAAG